MRASLITNEIPITGNYQVKAGQDTTIGNIAKLQVAVVSKKFQCLHHPYS